MPSATKAPLHHLLFTLLDRKIESCSHVGSVFHLDSLTTELDPISELVTICCTSESWKVNWHATRPCVVILMYLRLCVCLRTTEAMSSGTTWARVTGQEICFSASFANKYKYKHNNNTKSEAVTVRESRKTMQQ